MHFIGRTPICPKCLCNREFDAVILRQIADCSPSCTVFQLKVTFQVAFFVPTQQVNAKALSLTCFPPSNLTTSKQKTNTAMATQVGFDVICKSAKTTNVTSCTHVGVRPSGQPNTCAMTKEIRPDLGTRSSLRLFNQTHHRAH